MNSAVRELVRSRAQDRCEYCGLTQDQSPKTNFQIEHIIARQHGGPDDLDNLALACIFCNLKKGPNLSGLDPGTDALTPLFNPRTQNWAEHFAERDGLILGITDVERTTVGLLEMNSDDRVDIRLEWADAD